MTMFVILLLAQYSQWVRQKYGGRWECWSSTYSKNARIWLPHNFYRDGVPLPDAKDLLTKEVY